MAKTEENNLIQIRFDVEKTKALRQFMSKKSLTCEKELQEYLLKMYEKYVPPQVREFIEPEVQMEKTVVSNKLQDKGDTPKITEYPQNTRLGGANP